MALGSTQPLREMSTRNLPGVKGWLAHKSDNLTAICEPTVQKRRQPEHLTTLLAPWAVTGIALSLPRHVIIKLYLCYPLTQSGIRPIFIIRMKNAFILVRDIRTPIQNGPQT
jgi:hypothetical protein